MRRRERDVVRALIVSPDSRILLVRIILTGRSFWITPGGGMEGTEDPHAALIRELNEEIGRGDWNIGPLVWKRSHTFDFEGETLTQHEQFHWVSSEWFDPPDQMPDAHENQYFGEFRWWTAEELAASKDDFAPRKLATHFRKAIEVGLPELPINVGI